jgi:hypothetical protein
MNTSLTFDLYQSFFKFVVRAVLTFYSTLSVYCGQCGSSYHSPNSNQRCHSAVHKSERYTPRFSGREERPRLARHRKNAFPLLLMNR